MNQPTNQPRKPHSIFFPLLLVVMGVFFLLANTGVIQNTAWGIVSTYWPLIFVIGGLDSLFKRDGWVGPLVGIGLGTVLLLGNLHYLQWGSLELLLRLWPILLVAWGLDIAFGKDHTVWNTILRVGLGLLLVVGIIWLSLVSPFGGAVKTTDFSQTLDSAQKSTLKYSVAAGDLTLAGGAADTILTNGTISLPKEMSLAPSYQAPVDGVSQFSIQGAGVVVLPFGSSAPWNVKVNSGIPLDITAQMGAGSMVLDLSGVMVEKFDSELGTGRTVITLPRTGSFEGKSKVAVGELVIRVPKGRNVILHTNIGIVGKQLPAGYTNTSGLIRSNTSSDEVVEMTLDVAVGSLVIQEIP